MVSFLARMAKEAAVAICGFVVGALAVTLVKDPFSYDIAPRIIKMWAHGQRLALFLPDGKGGVELVGEYSLYRFSLGADTNLSGRLIMRDDNGDDTNKQSYITGFEGSDILSFTYRPIISRHSGGGSFVGRRDDTSFVGTLTGLDKAQGEKDCALRQFIAVVADNTRSKLDDLAKSQLESFVPSTLPADQNLKFSCSR